MELKTEQRVKELEAAKLQLIKKYMAMQDEADAMNEKIYGLCCEIEALNQRIEIVRAEEEKRKKKAAKAAKSNGHSPANGSATQAG